MDDRPKPYHRVPRLANGRHRGQRVISEQRKRRAPQSSSATLSRAAEAGFTLIELMIALLVFFIAVPPITYGLISAFIVTAANRERVLAANLVSQTLDGVRSTPFANLSIGTSSTSQTVDNVAFTVTQTVKPVAPPEQTTNICGASTSGDGSADYLLVSVAVTWPQSGTSPVSGRTMLAPPATVIANGDAEVIIQVFSADQNPAINVPVTINTSPSETVMTDSNGCAAFPYLNPGQSYTLTATGYANQNQQAASITTPVLALNQTYQPDTRWDVPTVLNAAVETECLLSSSPSATYGTCPAATDVIYPSSCTAGTSPCSGSSSLPVPVVFVPFGLPSDRVISGAGPAGNPATSASTTGFPYYTTNYQAWAGTCADAQPSAAYVEGLTSVPGEAALIWPQNPTVALFAQTLTSSSYGRTVTVTHATDSSCTNGETYSYTIPSSLPPGDTSVAVAVPAGTAWTFQRSGGSPMANITIPPTSSGALAL